MSAEFINLLEAVNQEAEAVGSLFRDTLPGRDALWEFLDVNGWFGVTHVEAGRNTLVATLGPMKGALDLWLRAYNRSRLFSSSGAFFMRKCGLFMVCSHKRGIVYKKFMECSQCVYKKKRLQ